VALALERIRAARHYPELARRRGIEGVVRVGFVVDETGRVDRVELRQGVDALLDEAACEAVRRAAPLPPLGEVEVTLDFHLAE
jgi:protein TonB